MSVTTAMQGLTAAHHDTQRDNSMAAREPWYSQAMGHFRWWWQVLGSNDPAHALALPEQRLTSARMRCSESFTHAGAAQPMIVRG
jgi:hypothetical protein